MTTVSVIIPAYNAAETLDRTLESVRNQTHPALDIIVVDDGSTDMTAALADAHAARDSRVRVLRQPNGGVAKARNTAIAASQADWVAPIDADDIWHPRTVARLLAAAREAPEPVAFAYTWSRRILPDDRLLGDMGRPRHAGWVLEPLVASNFLGNASASLVSRAAALRVGGYDPGLQAAGAHGAEDLDIYLRLARIGPVAVAPGYHVGYRQIPGSMSRAPERMRRSIDLALEKIRGEAPELSPDLFDLAQANFDLYAAGLCFAGKRPIGLLGYALKAGRRAPVLTAEHLGVFGTLVITGALRLTKRPLFLDLDPEFSRSTSLGDWYEARQKARLDRLLQGGGAAATGGGPAREGS